MTELESSWRAKTDRQLVDAVAHIADYTPEGQSVIRAELTRRGLALSSPGQVDEEFAKPLLKHGSLLQRMCAYLIDYILVIVVGSLTLGLIVRALLAFGLYPIADLMVPNIRPGPVDMRTLWESYSVFDKLRIMVVIVALPPWTYKTLFHGSRWQATLGKMFMGLKIVDSRGQPIGYKRSALRSLTRGSLYICTFGLSGLVNLYLIDKSPKRQAIHDRIVGSEVVRAAWLKEQPVE